MKNIVVCIGNGLLSEAIIKMLKNSGEFKPFRVLIQKKSNIANDCVFFLREGHKRMPQPYATSVHSQGKEYFRLHR